VAILPNGAASRESRVFSPVFLRRAGTPTDAGADGSLAAGGSYQMTSS
jgi:hypothetical protein